MRRLLIVGITVAVLFLAGASVAMADPSPLCNGQACTGGWYTTPVTFSWNPGTGTNEGGCGAQNYSGDTNQSDLAPYLSNPSELPDYAYCTVQIPVAGGTETITATYLMYVETSSPVIAALPSRPADSAGWYNHAVTAGYTVISSFSGIASCTPTTYSGPSTTNASVTERCIDNAGKPVSATSAPFAYDATPPTLTATASPGDQSATLIWQTSGDVAPVASMSVTRTPSAGSASPAVVYSGGADGFQDSHLKNGVRYTYTITARDQAGNVATQTVHVTPGARVLGPAPNAHLTAPPMLSWTPVPGASYYNVQLYRGDPRKVLSLWPATASLQLKHTWRFEGRRYRLKPSKYKWFVWPGFGRRKAGRYGHMIGSGTFVVVR